VQLLVPVRVLLQGYQVHQHLISLQEAGVPVLLHMAVPDVFLPLLLLRKLQHQEQQLLLLPVPMLA
jgi:hypothetical protein